MSTKTYGHLHEDDRAWFIADSFRWLVDQNRGEPMRAQKAHVCYACDRTIPTGERYRRLRGGDARINLVARLVDLHVHVARKRRCESRPGQVARPRLRPGDCCAAVALRLASGPVPGSLPA